MSYQIERSVDVIVPADLHGRSDAEVTDTPLVRVPSAIVTYRHPSGSEHRAHCYASLMPGSRVIAHGALGSLPTEVMDAVELTLVDGVERMVEVQS